MPMGSSAAYVDCFVGDQDYIKAVERVLQKLLQDGVIPKEIMQPIYEIESEKWGAYVEKNWPNYIELLPSQLEFDEKINKGGVVYGPFGLCDLF